MQLLYYRNITRYNTTFKVFLILTDLTISQIYFFLLIFSCVKNIFKWTIKLLKVKNYISLLFYNFSLFYNNF